MTSRSRTKKAPTAPRVSRARSARGANASEARSGSGRVTALGLKYQVELKVDGKKLPLKEFLHDLLGGAITGMVAALHGVHDPRRVEAVVHVASADSK